MNTAPESSSPSSSTEAVPSPWPKLLAGLAVLAALFLVGRQAGAATTRFADWVNQLGPAGPAVFIAGYALAVVVLAPGSLLTLAAGAVFGLARGTAFAFTGAVLGSTAAFLVSRYVARDLVASRLAANRRLAAVDRAVEKEGGKIVFLLRLSPVFPFSLLNYALGLTRVRLGAYVAASVGMLPGTLLYVYYGKLAGDVAALAGGVAPERDAGYWVVLGLGLAATVAVTTVITRIARRAVEESADV
jgi:MYXO-CTERM domain-containing protein